jgi:hypothetical protein
LIVSPTEVEIPFHAGFGRPAKLVDDLIVPWLNVFMDVFVPVIDGEATRAPVLDVGLDERAA